MSAPTTVQPDHGLARQAGVLFVGKVLATVSETIVPLLVVRTFSKAESGVLFAILLVYSTTSLVLTAGFPDALMYFLPTRALAARRAIAWRFARGMLGLGTLVALLFALVGTLGFLSPAAAGPIARHLAGDGSALGGLDLRLILWFAPYAIGDFPSRLIPNLLVVEGRARAAAFFGVFKATGTALAIIVPMALGAGLRGVVVSVGAFGLVTGAALVFYLRALYGDAQPAQADVSFMQILRFGLPVSLTDIVSTLNNSFDRYLILFSFSAATFALFQAGAWQIPIVAMIPYAVGTVFAPRYRQLLGDGRSLDAVAIWRSSVEKVSLLVVPLTTIFIVGADETMALLFTPSYVGAAPVFRLYSVLTLGRVAAFGSLLVAAGHPDYVLWAALLSLVSNILISVPALWLFGFVGPALGTTLAFIPTAILYSWFIAKATGVPLRRVFPLVEYGRILVLASVAGALATFWKHHVALSPATALAMEAAIVLATFALLGTVLGVITRNDWRFLASWIPAGSASRGAIG